MTNPLGTCACGWDAIAAELQKAIGRGRGEKPILVVDCYPGVDEAVVLRELESRLAPRLAISAAEAFHAPEKVDQLVAPFLGSAETGAARFCSLSLVNLFDAEPLWRFRRMIDELKEGLVLIVGCGASLIAWGHILVYADLARQTARRRFQHAETVNLGAANRSATPAAKEQRAFFVDWRIGDRWKRPLIRRWDYVLDTNEVAEPKLADATDVRAGMREAVARPFRLAPFTENAATVNGVAVAHAETGWRSECALEENSLILSLGDARVEIPALDLLYYQPRALLGEAVQLRSREAFPIRFNVIATSPANPSCFQIHPPDSFLRDRLALRHTQDDLYYVMNAGATTKVHLAALAGRDEAELLPAWERGRNPMALAVEMQADAFPARSHEPFRIPPGTVHGVSAESMVLHISASPYRVPLGALDGRALNLNHRLPSKAKVSKVLGSGSVPASAQNHESSAARDRLGRFEPVAHGEGWREEKMAGGEGDLIEVRRHWFAVKVPLSTGGVVNVLNLVEGAEAVVESPTDAFAPFVVHYAETFIVPAAVDEYTIQPHGPAKGQECGTIKAMIRA